MISCEEALEWISLELDGLLDETGRKKLEEHLARCASCRALKEDLAALHRELPRLEALPPEGFAQSVLEALPPRRPLRRRAGLRRLAGLAACALLCAGLWQLVPKRQNAAAPSAPPAACEPAARVQSQESAAGADGQENRQDSIPENRPEEPRLQMAAAPPAAPQPYTMQDALRETTKTEEENSDAAQDTDALTQKGRPPASRREHLHRA